MNNLKVQGTDNPAYSEDDFIPWAEEMRLDEGGIDLIVDGETALSGSFHKLDNFELAFRVLPEDFELEDTGTWCVDSEQAFAKESTLDELESVIWIHLNEYANRKGLKK